MKTFEKVHALNDYNENAGYYDDVIHSFDESTINELFPNAWEAFRACHYGDIDFTHNFFRFDGYGNIETLSDWQIDELYNEITEG